jgi:hypothetical protein
VFIKRKKNFMRQVFKATDGKEFQTQEEAIAHENVALAYKTYQDAVEALNAAIGEKLVTADGYPFKIGGHTNYYYVSGRFSGRPDVLTESAGSPAF